MTAGVNIEHSQHRGGERIARLVLQRNAKCNAMQCNAMQWRLLSSYTAGRCRILLFVFSILGIESNTARRPRYNIKKESGGKDRTANKLNADRSGLAFE